MNLGPMEIIVILIIALLIFGPKNLPKLGSAMGKTVKNIREGMEGDDDTAGSASKQEGEAANVVVETVDADSDSDADAPAGDVVFCNKCGAKNDAGAAFCNKCGTKLSGVAD